jgi:hypothetical protein
MFGGAEGYDYACHLVCDSEQQFSLQLILNTFKNLIEYCQVYRILIRKEVPCLLHFTQRLWYRYIEFYERRVLYGLLIQCCQVYVSQN